jgi:hypothetical protein
MKIISVKLVNGTKYAFHIDERNYETVSSLKNRIEACLDIKKGMQRLLYRGSPLQNELCLNNLPDGSIVHLILQLETIDE